MMENRKLLALTLCGYTMAFCMICLLGFFLVLIAVLYEALPYSGYLLIYEALVPINSAAIVVCVICLLGGLVAGQYVDSSNWDLRYFWPMVEFAIFSVFALSFRTSYTTGVSGIALMILGYLGITQVGVIIKEGADYA